MNIDTNYPNLINQKSFTKNYGRKNQCDMILHKNGLQAPELCVSVMLCEQEETLNSNGLTGHNFINKLKIFGE